MADLAGVTRVAMEATRICSMPACRTLIGGFDKVLVCNAGHVKNVPGRKTDLLPMLSGWRTCWSAGCWPAASSRPRRSRRPGT